MHLKRIEMQGFKSFADRIEIEFEKGITSIVGPNGSGKSNISDAIRWVLGEQSIKTLRGTRMEDIIFSGTDLRRPLGFTEVSIIIDNNDGKIPIEYKEVAITRRMFRSGESEYFINKSPCRLKDIRGLLMDTGIGIDGYSIIGQGKIDEVLSTRAEDRRGIFEEAAGIVKYKFKKEAAERKLEKTNSNLLRIKDILDELEKQSTRLRNQSRKAKKFLKLSERLRELEVNLIIRDIDTVKKGILTSKDGIARLKTRIDKVLDDKHMIDENFKSTKAKVEESEIHIDKAQDEKTKLTELLNDMAGNL
ncbi:MAG: AAA family ATPase, partial [Tissierellia bacterium]|nr:AAA family ATPase [Tissierellia bacterium]